MSVGSIPAVAAMRSFFPIVFILGALASITAFGLAAYVVIHFVAKYW
jgi:predicted tellurium resistance membrane protein TerC